MLALAEARTDGTEAAGSGAAVGESKNPGSISLIYNQGRLFLLIFFIAFALIASWKINTDNEPNT